MKENKNSEPTGDAPSSGNVEDEKQNVEEKSQVTDQPLDLTTKNQVESTASSPNYPPNSKKAQAEEPNECGYEKTGNYVEPTASALVNIAYNSNFNPRAGSAQRVQINDSQRSVVALVPPSKLNEMQLSKRATEYMIDQMLQKTNYSATKDEHDQRVPASAAALSTPPPTNMAGNKVVKITEILPVLPPANSLLTASASTAPTVVWSWPPRPNHTYIQTPKRGSELSVNSNPVQPLLGSATYDTLDQRVQHTTATSMNTPANNNDPTGNEVLPREPPVPDGLWCHRCGIKFERRDEFMDHECPLAEYKTCQFDKCDFPFKTINAFKKHCNLDHPDQIHDPLKCPECQRDCKDSGRMMSHSMNKGSCQPTVCSNPNCSEKLTYEHFHKGSCRQYKCAYSGCGYTFPTLGALNYHKNKDHNQCDYPGCNQTFLNLDALKRHKKSEHKEE